MVDVDSLYVFCILFLVMLDDLCSYFNENKNSVKI